VSVAEILYDGTRSKGEGIVQFGETAEAQTAGEKFTGYMYGGRPLGTCLGIFDVGTLLTFQTSSSTPDGMISRLLQSRAVRRCRSV
jgi:hypothetical protein